MKKMKPFWSYLNPLYWPIWLGISLLWLITRLPWRYQCRLGRGMGLLLYSLPTRLKSITEVNLRLCFPTLSSAERTTLMKKNFSAVGLGLIEAANAWWAPDKKLPGTFKLNGLEHVDAVRANNKGIILVGPHGTSLEMIARLMASHYSFAVMYRPHKKAIIAGIQERFRHANIHYVPRHRLRELLRCLSQNMPIWYAYDVDGGSKNSVFAPFFGVNTASLTTLSRLAELSGAAIIPFYFSRTNDSPHYEITLQPALENFPSGNIIQDATRMNALLEQAIKPYPEQYIWQYKRFKTRPVGEQRFY